MVHYIDVSGNTLVSAFLVATRRFADRWCHPSRYTLPVQEYSHSEGCSVTGGFVCRGAVIRALRGHYFYADYCGGWRRSFCLQDQWPTLATWGAVPGFGQVTAGELCVPSAEGRIFRTIPR